MDTFFTQKYCDRCGRELGYVRIMSMFNTDCLCADCAVAETTREDYEKAREAEAAAVRNGDYNFSGIGMGDSEK